MPASPRADARRGAARALRDTEPAYPAGLRDLRDPPRALFVCGGELPPVGRAVAMVGSRAASRYGLAQAHRLAGDLARLGMVVVSGLARGIDAAAHRGAMDANGRTVAVLPSGLDTITPRHHRDLANEIVARGVLVSEWERGEPKGKGAFVVRNRLIAALAAATVVVEAAEKSGALTTAAFARRLGRPVLAVPGDVDRVTARGCHALIRSGARLCERAVDILEAVGGGEAVTQVGAVAAPAEDGAEGTTASRLLAVMGSEPASVETLAAAAGVSVAEALSALLALDWAGAASAHPGQRWARGRR